MKYGVISLKDFQEDLLDWSSLYIAGRLHKPLIKLVLSNSTESEMNAIHVAFLENRRAAVDASLLQMPDKFSLRELLAKIVSLSYGGDIRKFIGEHDQKIQNIVDGSYDELSTIYHPLLTRDPLIRISGDRIDQDITTPAIYHRLNLLPFAVKHILQQNFRQANKRYFDVEEDLFALAHRHDISQRVGIAIFQIVRKSSAKQTLKNACTAGFVNSASYLFRKIKSSRFLRGR